MTKVFTPLASIVLFAEKIAEKEELRTETARIGSWDAVGVNLEDICPMGEGEGGTTSGHFLFGIVTVLAFVGGEGG